MPTQPDPAAITPVTEATIADEQIRELRATTLGRRQNAHTRSLRADCDAALRGDPCCRRHVADMWNKRTPETP